MVILFFLAGSAFAANTGVVSMGDDTFSVTREAPNTFKRDTDPLKKAALEEAEKFCREQGKQVKVVTWYVYKPRFISGYANAKLVFKMVNPGEQEVASAPAQLPAASAALASSESGDLYTELLKLDDLRKKGILTEKEFAAAKKKVLKRAN